MGFANSNMGVMIVSECPKCFTHWYSHARLKIDDSDRDLYDYFIEIVERGKNKHHVKP